MLFLTVKKGAHSNLFPKAFDKVCRRLKSTQRAEVPNLLAPYIWRYTATDYDGNCHEIAFRRHEPGHNHYYEKIEGELVEHGIARRVTFGCADAHLVDCVKETDYMVKRLQEEPTLFMHEYN